MVTYTFSYSVANTVCDDMDAVNRQLTQALEDMAANVERTMADWRDDAKDQYWQAKAAWQGAAGRMPVNLAAARQALIQISGEYSSVEKTGVNTWSGYTV
jgi:uncharacterized protein YukE